MHTKNPYTSLHWPGKLCRKLDVFRNGKYSHSTNAYESRNDAICGAAFRDTGLPCDAYTAKARGYSATYAKD